MSPNARARSRENRLPRASFVAAVAVLVCAAPAHAQRLRAEVELGGGSMLSTYQQNADRTNFYGSAPGFGPALQGTLRGGLAILPMIAVDVQFAAWFFPSSTGRTGAVFAPGAGVRFEPLVGHFGRAIVDAHGDLALTGSYVLPMFDIGLGYEFRIVRGLGVGPMARYGYVIQTDRSASQRYPYDAAFWSIGLAGAFRNDDPRPPDSDHDGIIDAEDHCPRDPAGAHPDPARVGCPLHDTDGDGVFDVVDQCPTVPAGEHPDPARPGCPQRDSDGDGVFDTVDRCPTVAQGQFADPDRPGCPDEDTDHDGVTNHHDSCPDVPAGPRPDPQRPGCPMGDRDHDGIPDDQDHCPDQPGAPDPNPERNGCPGLVQLDQGRIRILRPVFFATRRDTILPRSYPVLQAVANALAAVPSIRRVSIEGHTDDVGGEAFNNDLSTRRARSVMAWLITHGGVEPGRLEARGFGESRPLVPGSSAQTREANRRVEFRIVDPAPDAPASPSPAPASSAQPTPSRDTLERP